MAARADALGRHALAPVAVPRRRDRLGRRRSRRAERCTGVWPVAEQIRAAERQRAGRAAGRRADGSGRPAALARARRLRDARASATAPGCVLLVGPGRQRRRRAATPGPSWPAAGCAVRGGAGRSRSGSHAGRAGGAARGRRPGRSSCADAGRPGRPDHRRPGWASAAAARCGTRCCRWSRWPRGSAGAGAGRRPAVRRRRRHRRGRPARRCAPTVTVCMGALKPALLVGPGPAARRPGAAGRHRPRAALPEPRSCVARAEPTSRACCRGPARTTTSTPAASSGVVAGSAEYPGAAQLCVGAARLGGAGVVRYAGHAARRGGPAATPR